MKRNEWLVPVAIGLLTVICCCVATAGFAGFWWARRAIQPVTAVPPPVVAPTPSAALILDSIEPIEQQTAQAIAGVQIPERNLFDLARRLEKASGPLAATRPVPPPAYQLGDTEVFWVHNVNNNSFYTATAILSYQTDHALWWVEDIFQLDPKDLEASAMTFENRTYPTDRHYFGSEWSPGVDNDPHVYLFLGDVPGVAGYFSGPDEYTTQIRPHSNEHEMFYINLNNAQPGNDYFDGILAHEFQHMIHWASDRNEDSWVNEGLSELAAQINGYDVGGADQVFTATPDTQLTSWPELADSAPHYGASYLFMAYFLQQYGGDAVHQLVAEPANGSAGFDAVLAGLDPVGWRFDDLFASWSVANYLDSFGEPGGQYGYADLHVERPEVSAQYDSYPVSQQATVHQYATDYIVLDGEGDVTVEFTGSLAVPLIGNETHSGDYEWWSMRGDEGDATLTRAFDLSGLNEATLQAWMWYDLEADYDYAYVEVSADAGQTWSILSNDHTTNTNPSGNSYGPAFTGISGTASEQPQWVQETFDLAHYVGGPVLVRFEVITDDSVNHRGLCVDGVSIHQLGYSDDAEQGDDGWEPAGWVRVASRVPQKFIVQLITIGQDTRVQRMAIDSQNHGSLTVNALGSAADSAVLAVSAVTPVSTEWASYSYQITQR